MPGSRHCTTAMQATISNAQSAKLRNCAAAGGIAHAIHLRQAYGGQAARRREEDGERDAKEGKGNQDNTDHGVGCVACHARESPLYYRDAGNYQQRPKCETPELRSSRGDSSRDPPPASLRRTGGAKTRRRSKERGEDPPQRRSPSTGSLRRAQGASAGRNRRAQAQGRYAEYTEARARRLTMRDGHHATNITIVEPTMVGTDLRAVRWLITNHQHCAVIVVRCTADGSEIRPYHSPPPTIRVPTICAPPTPRIAYKTGRRSSPWGGRQGRDGGQRRSMVRFTFVPLRMSVMLLELGTLLMLPEYWFMIS